MAPLLGPYNDAAEQIRQTVAQAFNLRELTVLKLSNE
jgi:hypothetical protein